MDLLDHDLGTAKWVADSNIMVIDHESQATPTPKTRYMWVKHEAKETTQFLTTRWIHISIPPGGMVVGTE